MTAEQTYEDGYACGQRDAAVICSPINTNGHTEAFYRRTNAMYEDAVYDFNPSDWQRGYADGFDAVCVEHGDAKKDGEKAT